MFFGTDLLFFEHFLFFISSLEIDHDPHVLYAHMTYICFFLYVSLFTRLYGQEKSLSYYDLFTDFGVLFYGRTLSLIFFQLLHKPTTSILPIHVDQ